MPWNFKIPIQINELHAGTILAYRKSGEIMVSLTEKAKEIEKGEIIKALQECNWVKSGTLRKLGITERMIGYKIKK